MLRLTIHAGPLEDVSRFNQLARLEIVYDKLSPLADYKVVLLERNRDVPAPRTLLAYPRWSASLWDLAARALALCLPDEPPATETVPKVEPGGKRCAFAREVSVIIEHAAGDQKNTLGTASLRQTGRKRGIYQAYFDEHTMKPRRTEVFEFAPAYFRPAELLLHACLYCLEESQNCPRGPACARRPPSCWTGCPTSRSTSW